MSRAPAPYAADPQRVSAGPAGALPEVPGGAGAGAPTGVYPEVAGVPRRPVRRNVGAEIHGSPLPGQTTSNGGGDSGW